MPTRTPKHKSDLSLRHAVATLAYRASKATRDVPDGFSDFRVAPGSRSAGEILSHMCSLAEWLLSQATGNERWRQMKPQSWTEDRERFFAALTAFDRHLASRAALRAKPGRLFQGGLADALTHVGQIAMLRRLAGAPVRGENYSVAKIKAGQSGADQPRSVKEFE